MKRVSERRQRLRVLKQQAIPSNCTDPDIFRRIAMLVEGTLDSALFRTGAIVGECRADRADIRLYKNAKQRAKKQGLPFEITVEDVCVRIPRDNRCPIILKTFEKGSGKVGPCSMSLDRVIPYLGYTRDNIVIISHLANTVKQNCVNPEIFRRVARYVEFGTGSSCL